MAILETLADVVRIESDKAEGAFIQLIEALTSVGLATEVRRGDDKSFLVFVKIASENLLKQQVYRYRVQDWLYGVRTSPPSKNLQSYFEEQPVVEAERLRLVYLLITKPKAEGGAGVTPKLGKWKFVSSVFPLHNHAFNRTWLKQWSQKYVLDENDINNIRDKFGEQVAFYFAFLQSYFQFLFFPAAFGFGAWLILGQFSLFYAIVNCLWCVIFFEYWKKKEVDLAVQWGVRGVSRIQHPRAEFQFERETQDPVTGEIIKVYSPLKRLQRQLLQLPFAIACLLVLGSLIASCFSIEIFIAEIYSGPFKTYLVFLPTVLLTIFMPALNTVLTRLGERLTVWENYETQDGECQVKLYISRQAANIASSASIGLRRKAFCDQLYRLLLADFPYGIRIRAIRQGPGAVSGRVQSHRPASHEGRQG